MTQSSLSFVRNEMLGPKPAPVSERGVMKWLRENLFSSVLNSILTVVGLLVVVWLVQAALPWLLNGVWTANSLGECRTIIAASAGEGASGACWAVVWEKFRALAEGARLATQRLW